MSEFIFWKDKEKTKIDPKLFSEKAEDFAKEIAEDNKISKNRKSNKITQIRKFYDEVVRLDMEAKTRPQEWDNSINRLTGTTGKEPFAPYSQEVIYYYPGMELAVFVLIDESAAAVEKIHCAMKKIGRWGYGKDASVGMGKFDVNAAYKALILPNAAEANA